MSTEVLNLVSRLQKVKVIEHPSFFASVPTLTVIVLTYQHVNYIKQCLESILNQNTSFPFEIIIGEDQSTDGTREICLEYAKKYPDIIRLLLHDRRNNVLVNGNPTARFNFLYNLSRARGKYIAFCEGDDYWTDVDKLQKQVDFLEEYTDYAISFHNAIVEFDDPRKKQIRYSEFPWNKIEETRDIYSIEDLIASPLCPTASVVFRKPNDFIIPEWFCRVPSGDMALQMLICRDKKIKFFNENWAIYRKHRDGITIHHKGDDIHAGRIYMYLRILEHYEGKYIDSIKKVIMDHLNQLTSISKLSDKDRKKLVSILPEYFKNNGVKIESSCGKPIKMTFVAYGPNQINGPNVWLQRILPQLLKRGIDPRVVFLMSSDDRCEIINNLRQQGISCVLVKRKKFTEQNIVQLLKIIKADAPDVFVPNLSVPAYYASRWIKASGIPTIGILHSDDNFHHELIENFVHGSKEYRLSGIVSVSKFIEELVMAGDMSKVKSLNCAYGIQMPDNIVREPIDKLNLVYTGRLIQRQKRIFDVLLALNNVVRNIPDIRATIYGEDREGGRVIETIKSYQLGEKLKYGGLLSYEEIFPNLIQHHVFVLLSDYEGLSISLMEAMGCGLVPICTKTRSGASELIKHNVNGLLVENREEEFFNAVKLLKNEKGLWQRLSKAARKTIQEEYTMEICADKWASFIRKVISKSTSTKDIIIPAENSIELPPRKVSDNGIAREDKRMPNSLFTSNKQSTTDNYLNACLTPQNMDLYCVRTAIKSAIDSNLHNFKGIFLDVGCGEMPYRDYLLKNSAISQYIGLDIENAVYQKNKKPDLYWDGKCINLNDNTIDCAFATEVFEHLPDLNTVLKEINRVLKPGGRLFFTIPFIWPLHDIPHDEYRYTPFSVQRQLEDSGFTNIKIKPLGGWDAALAQMIGLWTKRKPMSDELREKYGNQLFPFYKELLKSDAAVDNFNEQKMFIGISGIATKALISHSITENIPKTDNNSKNNEVKNKIGNCKSYRTENNKPKVTVIQGGFPAVSATFILDQMTGLIDRGYKIENWSTYNPNETEIHSDIIKYNLIDVTKHIRLPEDNLRSKPEIWIKQFVELNHLNQLDNTDIFHVHYGYTFNLLRPIFALLDNKYVVVSFHGYDASRYFQENGDNCYDYLFKRANLITTPSFHMKSELVKRGCPPDKISIHRYGVDLDKFVFQGEKKIGPKIKLLSVARLVEKKGIEFSLRAIANIKNRENILYRIIGDGPLKSDLKNLTHRYGISDQVEFLGVRNKADVIKAMAAADIYLLNSITAADGDKEGLPVSLIEAQAMGLPVISSHHAGIPELVIDGKTGFLTQEKDTDQITLKLKKLISDKALRDEMSFNARKIVLQEFNIHKLNDQLAAILQEGLNSYKNKPSVINLDLKHSDLYDRLKNIKWIQKFENYKQHFEFASRINHVSNPLASIIIISSKASKETEKCLSHLIEQTQNCCELIFVDNGNESEHSKKIKTYVDTFIRLNKNTGAFIARNIGAVFANAALLIFIDDDAVPEANLIKTHIEIYHNNPDIWAIRGRCHPKNKSDETANATHYDLGDQSIPYYLNLEGNMSIRSEKFFEVYGFSDEIFFGYGGAELSYRLKLIAGNKEPVWYFPDPLIYHDYSDSKNIEEKIKIQEESLMRIRKIHPDFDHYLTHYRDSIPLPRDKIQSVSNTKQIGNTYSSAVDKSQQEYNSVDILKSKLISKNWPRREERYKKYFEYAEFFKQVENPAISVIAISWRKHPDTIRNFEILSKQRDQNFELIFVDNGGKPWEFDSLKPYIDTYIRLNQNTGAYLSRNIGAVFANAPILLFLEDDGIPTRNFVSAHLKAFSKYDVIAVRGVYQPKTKHNPFNSLAVHYYKGDKPFPLYSELEGNSSYDSSIFFKVGGWDDNIKFGHGGVELSYRLSQIEPLMHKQIYSPDPIIYHDYATDQSHLNNKKEKQNKSKERLRAKFPDFEKFLASWSQYKGREDLLIKKNAAKKNTAQFAEKNLISVLIPTYNREKYITSSIESAISQNYENIEILVVDDGSTDNTEDICKSFSSEKLRYICKDHTGAPETRNRAIQEAEGTYILWLDSDDLLKPNTINDYIQAITNFPDVDVFYGDLEIIDAQGNFKQALQYPDYYNQNEVLLSRLLIANAIPNPGTLIKRSVYQNYRDYNLDYKRAHDYEFWCRVATKIKFKHVGTFVCKWRWHDTNMSSGSVQFDTSYDIQIKKELLKSYSLQDLFPHLNWQDEEKSLETAYFTIANAFNKLKGYQDAVEYYEKCLDIIKREDYYCALGLTHFQLNNLPESIQAFDEALKINPQNENAKEISANLKKIRLSTGVNIQTRSSEIKPNKIAQNNTTSRPQLKDIETVSSGVKQNVNTTPIHHRIVFYALRELHLPVLLPIYQTLAEMGAAEIGFMAPVYRESDDVALQEGLSDNTLKTLKEGGIPFWGHEPQKPFDCVVVADVCYDRVDGWGPIVCVGHGTISKGIFFSNNPICRRENFATVLCVPGPWYKQSFGNQVITHIAPTGFSKMDALAEKSNGDAEKLLSDMGFSPGKKTILFAPTFNPELTALEILWTEWPKLDRRKYQVIFKLHGATHQHIKDQYKKLAATQSNFCYVSEPGIAPYMHACDILVSDVSSVYVEFFALGKPIILVNNPEMHNYAWYDPNNIEHQVRDAAYQINKSEDIHKTLQSLEYSDPLQPKRTDYAKQLFPPLDGQNSKRIAEQIIKVAAGEVRLVSQANAPMNVYLPSVTDNIEQLEENLKRASGPLNLFSHEPHISHIGKFAVNRLQDDQVSPTPLICMTGQYVWPHQWDYMWHLADHFNRVTGVFGPLAKNKLDDCYQQQGHLSDDVTELIHRNLQAHHKVHKSTTGQISTTRELNTDGMIITKGVDQGFIGHLLEKARNPAQTEISCENIRAAGYQSGELDGFYCYTRPGTTLPDEKRIRDLTAHLKSQPGNAVIAAELKTLLTSPRPMLPLSQCPKRVSIVIPYFQQLDTVEETLRSVCHQTYPNFEIIFVNDGSKDEKEVIQILQTVAQQYPEVKINYYYKDNTGLADTRNFGIEKACSEYILPLDSDDLIASNFLEKTVAVLDQDPSTSFVFTEVLFWGAKNEIWGTIDFDPKVLLTQNLMTCTTLFRKTLWERIGGYDLKMNYGYEDWNFWVSAVEKGYKGSNIHQPLFLYRRKKNSMLENRVHYDPIAKEQIVRNHTSLYKELTPEALNQLRQCIGIIPPQLVRHSKKINPPSEHHQPVDPSLNKTNTQFEHLSSKKILFVCHDFPPYKYAGAQLYACNLAKELNSKGYDVRIFHPVDISNRNSNENKVLYDIVESTTDGLSVYQINIDEKSNPAQFWGFYNQKIEEKFKDVLLAEKFDLVHFHLLYRLSSSLPKVTKDLGVASVCTLHDYWLLCPLGHMVDSNMRACRGPESALKCAHCVCGFKREPDDQVIEYFTNRFKSMRDAYEVIDTKISPSHFLAETHAQHGFSKPQVLPLGWLPIDRKNNKEVDQRVIFGYCGQIISRKGLDILIKALDGMNHNKWKLNIYGEGYDSAYLNMILEQIKYNDQIEYKGKFTTTDLPRIYSQIDVAVIPSRRENYPLTLLEALSAKVPVVASDVGGVREMITDKVQGFIYPKDDVESLRRILTNISNNPQKISQMQTRIEPIKTIKENAKEMDLIYQSGINKDKAMQGNPDVHNVTHLQAVILAAGRGTRLGGPNGKKPKCMAVVGQETIIERQIHTLQAVGVQDIYVVVGYKQDLVKQFITERYENIKFIENPIYDSTNTIYSLYLAIPFLNQDFFYLNGDVLFRKELLEKLKSETGSGMAVELKKCGDEEVKVRLDGRRITSISKKVPQSESAGEFIGVGLFRKAVHEAFFRNLKHEVEQNNIINDYFEHAMNKTAKEIDFVSVDITGEPAIEIDFPEDLEKARLLAKEIDAGQKANAKTVHRSHKNSSEKLTSIIMLTRNQIDYTQKCIDSIFKHTHQPFELIIVDNGSTDGTVKYLESETLTENTAVRIKIIKNDTNRGFAAGNNQGMAVAKGDYLLLMNNDIVVTPGWLEHLVFCAEQRPEIGIVGPRSNCVSGPQIIENVSYDTQSLQGLAPFANEFARHNAEQAQQVLRVVGFCMLIKRAVIEKIGGMDDRYGLGNFEDDDFSLRAAIAGFESWIAMDCFIHHFGSRTFVGEKIDYRASLLKNWGIFKNKWGLPQDLPYGSPYRLSQIKNIQFDPMRHYYPLDIESEAMKKNDNTSHSAQTLYTAIQANLSTKSSSEVIEELQNLIASYPEFAVAYNDLGVLYTNAGKKDEALHYYEKAVQLEKENLIFQKNLADFYYAELRRVEDALHLYVKILEADPEDVETLLITGHICVSIRKFEDAQVFYQRVLALDPTNKTARENFEKLSQLNPAPSVPMTPEEIYQEIQPQQNDGDPHKAITSLTELLERFPDFALAHNDLGVLYYQMDEKEKARQHYERAVELMPANMNFQKNLADFYCIELGRIEDALKIYVRILGADPQDIDALMATAQICKALEKFDDARDFFNQVLQIEPSNAEARMHIQEMESQMSEASLGAESLEDAYCRLQEELNMLSPQEAIAELEKFMGSHPDFAIGHNDLAVCYYNAGNKEKALHHYQQAAQLQPENITLQKNLADFLFVEQGQVEAALQIYVNILTAHPTDVETLLITGHICVALKKYDDAKVFYERVLTLAPGNEDASQNLKAIHKRRNESATAQPDTFSDSNVSSIGVEPLDRSPETFADLDAVSQTNVSILVNLDGIDNRVKECLKSIQMHTAQPHELLLIDRKTTKGMRKWAQQLVADNDHYRIVDCRHQAGWAACINQVMQQASGDLIFLLHNDVVLPNSWLEAFVMGIKCEPNTGVMGPMSNRVTGIQQMMRLDEFDRPDFETAAAAFFEHNKYSRVKTQKLSDICLGFRCELIAEIGDFDEQFALAEVAVEDFCHRVAAAGYQNWIAADTYVYHYDRHKTPENSTAINSDRTKDFKKYKEKWNDAQNPDVKSLRMVENIVRADELRQKGHIDQAVKTLLAAIGTQPEEKRLYYTLAEVLIAAKRFQDAKDALMEVPSINGNPEPQKIELLGYAEEGLANYDAAQSCVEQLLAINPQHAPALNLKGILAYHRGDRDLAEKHFKQAIVADPAYGEPYTNLGALQLEAEQQAEALKSFEKGFRLTPTDLDIAANYHGLVAEIAGYEKAENITRQSAALYPNDQKIKYMLIDFLIQQGKFEMAMPEIEDAIIKFGIDDGILAAALKVREKLGPITIQNSAKKVPVSVCMIIKDEEKYLARSLASVKPIVDEMIVVDTGSADRSKDIAITFGAQVYDYDWENDFAAARNFSISRASGQWILILDGDEVISSLDHDPFRKLVAQKPKTPVAYTITTRNYSPLANIVGWVPNDGKYPNEEAAIGWLPSEKVRLFYGKDQIRFEGAVHELVDPVLKRKNIKIEKCSIPVHHYGRLEKEKLDRKGEIYFEIGQKKLSEMGEDVNALRELAIQATILERNQEALDLWQRLLAVNPISELSAIAYVNMGTVYSRLNQFEDALDVAQKALQHDPNLKEAQYNCAVAELHCGNATATVKILENLLNGFPDYPPAQFILAAAYACAGQKDKALERLQNQKNTPMGVYLASPCLELGQSLIAAKRIQYALWVLGIAIECDIVNKEIIDLFNTCMHMDNAAQKMSGIPQSEPAVPQPAKFENLPR